MERWIEDSTPPAPLFPECQQGGEADGMLFPGLVTSILQIQSQRDADAKI